MNLSLSGSQMLLLGLLLLHTEPVLLRVTEYMGNDMTIRCCFKESVVTQSGVGGAWIE